MQIPARPRRSMLFVPCDRPEMLEKAGRRGADSLILNLEDAVAPEQRAAARENARLALQQISVGSAEVIVRINAIDTEVGYRDLLELAPLSPDAIMLPKVAREDEVRFVAWTLDRLEEMHGLPRDSISLMAMIESASGVEHSFSIASSHHRVSALVLGAADLALDLDSRPDEEQAELVYARQRIIIAGRAAHVDAIDSPHMRIDDISDLRASAQRARRLGFAGKTAIHPAQVPVLNATFSPSEAEIAWANRILEAFSAPEAKTKGALLLDGGLIEAPHILQAERILARAIHAESNRSEQGESR